MMDPAVIEHILGPRGAVVILAGIVWHLYRENRELRNASMKLLETYQKRDEEERRLRMEEERDRRRLERPL